MGTLRRFYSTEGVHLTQGDSIELMTKDNTSNGANLGFEKKLWEMADNLRGHMDAAEYKDVVLGLIFLKYI